MVGWLDVAAVGGGCLLSGVGCVGGCCVLFVVCGVCLRCVFVRLPVCPCVCVRPCVCVWLCVCVLLVVCVWCVGVVSGAVLGYGCRNVVGRWLFSLLVDGCWSPAVGRCRSLCVCVFVRSCVCLTPTLAAVGGWCLVPVVLPLVVCCWLLAARCLHPCVCLIVFRLMCAPACFVCVCVARLIAPVVCLIGQRAVCPLVAPLLVVLSV